MRNVEFEMKDWGTQTNSTFLIPNSTLRTQLTGPQKSLLIAMLTMMIIAQAPLPGYTEELPTQSKQAVIPELELIKEEETVSIASRYEQPISQAPSNVYVITDEDIRHSGATDIPTILRRVPGLDVMQTTGAEFNVSARGNNQILANKMLVLVDGRSIFVDAQAIVYWKAIPVTLPEIKRIEVLKGPASALYGYNAFDGVINIITKSPQEMKGTTLQFGGGEFGAISSAAIHANTIGKFGYRLSVGHDQNTQWRNRDALAFRSHKFNLQTEYALSSDSKLSVSGGLVDTNRFDGPLSGASFNTATPALGYANAVYERPNFFLRAYWNRWDDTVNILTHPLLANFLRFTDQNGSSSVRFRADTYNIESQHSVDFGTANRLTYGFNYRYNTLSGNLFPTSSYENRAGFYVQDEWKATQTLTFVAGARYDLNTFIHATISPRAALLYQPIPDHTFRLGFSVAYRPPTLHETSFISHGVTTLPPPIPSPPTRITQGSTGLAPEQIVSYEAGYQGWYLKHRLTVRANMFFNHISDLIIPSSPQPIQGGNADIYGGEAGIEFLATTWLSGFANYSYQEVSQTFTADARRGVPRHKWNAGLRGEWDNGLSGEIGYHHVGAATYPLNQAFSSFAPFGVTAPDTRVGSYNLLNLRIAYKFWHEKAEAGYLRDAEVALSAYNSLNDTHKEHPLGDQIGSRVMGWITVRY
jgi:iron complex outermembrane receptor protein